MFFEDLGERMMLEKSFFLVLSDWRLLSIMPGRMRSALSMFLNLEGMRTLESLMFLCFERLAKMGLGCLGFMACLLNF